MSSSDGLRPRAPQSDDGDAAVAAMHSRRQQTWLDLVRADKKLPPDVVTAAEIIDRRFRCDADGYISVEPFLLAKILDWPRSRAFTALEVLWVKGYLDKLSGHATANALDFKIVGAA
jgi:hypothetical protein